MKSPKYRIVGILEPGIINAMIDGRFQNIHLHDADENTLEKLYNSGSPYVQLTPEGVSTKKPDSPKIETKPISKSKKRS
jgi:hypothetical protein